MGRPDFATEEAHAHDNYKGKIASIDEEGTVITRAHSGKPCRLIRNDFTEEWEGRKDEIEPFALQLLHVGKPMSEVARLEGDVEHGSAPAGQGSGLIHAVVPAREVVEDIMAGARETLARINGG